VRLALDTNILAYAEGVNGAAMKRAALELIGRLPQDDVFLPVQALVSCLMCRCAKPAERQQERAVRFSLGRTLFLSSKLPLK
jgi:predicted nucleic acid-binding protein